MEHRPKPHPAIAFAKAQVLSQVPQLRSFARSTRLSRRCSRHRSCTSRRTRRYPRGIEHATAALLGPGSARSTPVPQAAPPPGLPDRRIRRNRCRDRRTPRRTFHRRQRTRGSTGTQASQADTGRCRFRSSRHRRDRPRRLLHRNRCRARHRARQAGATAHEDTSRQVAPSSQAPSLTAWQTPDHHRRECHRSRCRARHRPPQPPTGRRKRALPIGTRRFPVDIHRGRSRSPAAFGVVLVDRCHSRCPCRRKPRLDARRPADDHAHPRSVSPVCTRPHLPQATPDSITVVNDAVAIVVEPVAELGSPAARSGADEVARLTLECPRNAHPHIAATKPPSLGVVLVGLAVAVVVAPVADLVHRHDAARADEHAAEAQLLAAIAVSLGAPAGGPTIRIAFIRGAVTVVVETVAYLGRGFDGADADKPSRFALVGSQSTLAGLASATLPASRVVLVGCPVAIVVEAVAELVPRTFAALAHDHAAAAVVDTRFALPTPELQASPPSDRRRRSLTAVVVEPTHVSSTATTPPTQTSLPRVQTGPRRLFQRCPAPVAATRVASSTCPSQSLSSPSQSSTVGPRALTDENPAQRSAACSPSTGSPVPQSPPARSFGRSSRHSRRRVRCTLLRRSPTECMHTSSWNRRGRNGRARAANADAGFASRGSV